MGLPRVLALPLLYLFSYALHVNALPRLSSFGRVGSKFDSSRKPGGLASERSFDLKNSNQLCLVTSAPLCLQTLEPLLRVRGGQGEVAQNQSAAPIALPEPETIPIPLPAPAAPASPPAPAAAPSPVKWRVVSFAAAAFAAILFAWPGEMKLDGVPVSPASMAPAFPQFCLRHPSALSPFAAARMRLSTSPPPPEMAFSRPLKRDAGRERGARVKFTFARAGGLCVLRGMLARACCGAAQV